jgi:hypothetical protein
MESKSKASDEFGNIVCEYPRTRVAFRGLRISEGIQFFAPDLR